MLQFFSLINDDLAGVEQLWKCLLLSLGSTFLFRDLNWTKLKKSSFRLWLSPVTIGLTSLISRICYASFIIYLFFNLTKFCWTCPFMVKIILQSLKNLEYYLEDLEIVWKKKTQNQFPWLWLSSITIHYGRNFPILSKNCESFFHLK